MKKKKIVKHNISIKLSEVKKLKTIISKGKHSARTINRARILLSTKEKQKDEQIAKQLNVCRTTVYNVKQRYIEGGLNRALYDAPRPGQPITTTVKEEAKIIALACTEPEDGSSKWTMDLLKEKVDQELSDRDKPLGRTTIYNVLLKNELKPWQKKNVVHS